jgi:hypothetical protein
MLTNTILYVPRYLIGMSKPSQLFLASSGMSAPRPLNEPQPEAAKCHGFRDS